MAKETSRFQPNHAGHHTPVAVNPGMKVNHQSQGAGAERGGRGGPYSGRDGKPKHTNPVLVHGAMKRRQIDGAGVGGMGHATATIDDGGQPIRSSAAAAPLAHAYGDLTNAKTYPTPKVAFGMRSPNHDLGEQGKAILAEALNGKEHWRA